MTPRGTVRRVALVTLGSLLLLLVAVASSLVTGVEHVELRRAFDDPTSVDAAILFGTRVNRILLGALVGAALAPAGVAFQALLRNPLADPFVLGVSGGAAVAGTAVTVLGGAQGVFGSWTLPVWAFAGAIASIGVVFALGRVRGRLVPNVALLAGVVVNALSSALTVAIRLGASPNAAHEALYWLTGTLIDVDGGRLMALSAYVVVGLIVLYGMALPMNAFALGDEAAHAVGIDTERARRVIFVAASLLTGAAVAFAGPIGFVGIVVPHVMRGLFGPDHRLLVPACAFAGGAFVVAADTVARLALVVLGREPTVGVLTALTGAPLFLWVLRKRGAERVF